MCYNVCWNCQKTTESKRIRKERSCERKLSGLSFTFNQITFEHFFNVLKGQQADQAVPMWTGIRGFAMEGNLRQRWDALLYGEKLILSEEETTSAGGCGVFSAAFSRPCSQPVLEQLARGVFLIQQRNGSGAYREDARSNCRLMAARALRCAGPRRSRRNWTSNIGGSQKCISQNTGATLLGLG